MWKQKVFITTATFMRQDLQYLYYDCYLN